MTTEVHSFQLGDFECVAILDFSNEFALDELAPNAEKEQLAEAARELGLGPDVITTDYVCLLIRTGEQNVLVDAGWGTRSEGRQGELLEGLQTIGIEPDGIDWIVITHGDRDHISGILDEEDRPVYPRARYVLWQGAWEFWTNEENYADWPQDIVAFITGTYTTIRDRLELVAAEEEFLPGFQLVPAVGHRYDHTVLRVSSQGKQLLHLADAVVHPIHMAHRGWYSMFDVELEQAVAIKQQLLDWAAEENALVFGAHFPFPSVGYVRHAEEGWQWLPMAAETHDQAGILALYGEGPARLEAALAGLAESDLDTALTEDSWTIRQIVHHVADGDDLWRIGLKAALGDTEAIFAFQWYWDIPQDSWAERWAYASRPIAPSLALLRAGRRQVVQLMQQVPDAWGRSIRIRWPNGQEQRVTAGGIVEMQAQHVLGHIQDIHQIRRAHNLGNAVI